MKSVSRIFYIALSTFAFVHSFLATNDNNLNYCQEKLVLICYA